MRSALSLQSTRRRRGAVVVYIAISLVVIIGMAALAVDLGALYSAQGEIQRTADAAALAAAGTLSGEFGDPQVYAVEAANDVASMNGVLRTYASLEAGGDIEFGKAVMDATTGRLTFAAGVEPADAVRVTVRRASDTSAGPIHNAFARLLGHETTDLQARAAAVLVPRDIALVIDISNSMNWDSQLRFWNRQDGGFSNLRDIWAALNGPEPSRPFMPGSELESEYAGDTGPTIGVMSTWGSPLIPNTYNPASDPGLWRIQKGQSQTLAAIITSLTARGYSADERTQLMGGTRDSTTAHWRNRCGVMLGLASWRSGRPGGRPGGDGDLFVENAETTWIGYPSFRGNWTWSDYIDWVQGSNFAGDGTNFRYRYGLKTFTDFLLEGHPENFATLGLWATPQQPLRALKDAVQAMADTITENDSLDHMSLEVFASTSRHEVDLTIDIQSIPQLLYHRQSGHYDRATNIGGGLNEAINELQSARVRPNAHKLIMCMSDGVPNVDAGGTYIGDGASEAMEYAREKAREAASLGFQIYTISVGYQADRALMQEIATIGGGLEFYAAGNPEEYTEQLEDIFRRLGGKRPVQLIE